LLSATSASNISNDCEIAVWQFPLFILSSTYQVVGMQGIKRRHQCVPIPVGIHSYRCEMGSSDQEKET